jgi:hypothetical protein
MLRGGLWVALLLSVLLPPRGHGEVNDFAIELDAGKERSDLGLIEFSRQAVKRMADRLPEDALDTISLRYFIDLEESSAVPDTFPTFPREMVFRSDSISLLIYIDTDWQKHQEALVRTICLGLVQAMSWKGVGQAPVAELPEPPLWLSEGLTQWTLQALQNEWRSSVLIPTVQFRDISPMAEEFRQIVWKAQLSSRAPGLEDVQGWKTLSELRVERLWQQAFSYWAFEAATRTESGQRALYQWIREQDVITPEPYWKVSNSEANWWNRQIRRSENSSEYLLSWERSTQSLRDLMVFEFVHAKTKDTELLRLGELPRLPRIKREAHPEMQELQDSVRQTVLKQMQRLRELESRAHLLYRPAINAYIDSLRRWLNGDMEAYRTRFNEGQERMRLAGKYHALVNDKLDWVVVNYEFSGLGEKELDYGKWARQLSRERERVRREARALQNRE